MCPLGQQSEGETFLYDINRGNRFIRRREFRWKRLEWPVVFAVVVSGFHKSKRHSKSRKSESRAGESVITHWGGDRLWGESRRRGGAQALVSLCSYNNSAPESAPASPRETTNTSRWLADHRLCVNRLQKPAPHPALYCPYVVAQRGRTRDPCCE